ncbi:MAG: type 4a pilus biogenesis protein PilO [Candidatus Omnitrophota bacterium]
MKIQIKKLNKRELILAVVVGTLLVIMTFKLLMFDPIRDKLISSSRKAHDSQLEIRKYIGLMQRKDEILKAKSQIERYLSLKGTEEDIVTIILTKVEAIASKSKLSISNMSPEQSTEEAGYKVYMLKLRAEGDMKKIFDFIYNLENADILFKIDRVALSAKDDTSSQIQFEADILAISFS